MPIAMTTMCAWCGRVIHEGRAEAGVTHTLCESCLPAVATADPASGRALLQEARLQELAAFFRVDPVAPFEHPR